jgi:hypothetical protein
LPFFARLFVSVSWADKQMSLAKKLYRYFAVLPTGKMVLWCYLIWYLVTVVRYFDPSPTIWLSSLGISAVIGTALQLSVSSSNAAAADHWQTFRLYLMPFCVSSFSSLIKGRGFFLIVPPERPEQYLSVGLCAAFVLLIAVLKRIAAVRRIDL